MYGQASHMVRCLNVIEGKPCPGMVEIPVNGKGACPKCGKLYEGPQHYFAERGKIRVKTPVQTLEGR
jgi:hypothetical protein